MDEYIMSDAIETGEPGKPNNAVDDLIDALGGTSHVARVRDVERSTVSEWRRKGIIPAKHVVGVLRMCVSRGYKPSAEAFRLPQWAIDKIVRLIENGLGLKPCVIVVTEGDRSIVLQN